MDEHVICGVSQYILAIKCLLISAKAFYGVVFLKKKFMVFNANVNGNLKHLDIM